MMGFLFSVFPVKKRLYKMENEEDSVNAGNKRNINLNYAVF